MIGMQWEGKAQGIGYRESLMLQSRGKMARINGEGKSANPYFNDAFAYVWQVGWETAGKTEEKKND